MAFVDAATLDYAELDGAVTGALDEHADVQVLIAAARRLLGDRARAPELDRLLDAIDGRVGELLEGDDAPGPTPWLARSSPTPRGRRRATASAGHGPVPG
jgi:hypothetical protein